MSQTSEKQLVLVAAWGFALAAMVLLTQPTLRADDSKVVNQPDSPCQLRIEVHGRIPFLSKIPLVKFFAENGEKACCDAQPDLERIGVDFDVLPGDMVAYLPNGERQVLCHDRLGLASEAPCACAAVTTASHSSIACAAVRPCDACQELETGKCVQEAKRLLVCGETEQVHHACHAHRDCEELAGLRVEIESLRAECKAQEKILEARGEMFEKLLQLSTENARLESRVDFLAERDEWRETMLGLVNENGKLRAAAELAEERQAMFKKSLEVTVENERLKLRIAELEQRDPASQKVSRTAKKPRAAKKDSVLK